MHHYDAQGNLITDPVKTVPPPAIHKAVPTTSNKNKEQPSKSHVEEDAKLPKETKKEKKKEKKVVKEPEGTPAEIKDSKKQKKISKPPETKGNFVFIREICKISTNG